MSVLLSTAQSITITCTVSLSNLFEYILNLLILFCCSLGTLRPDLIESASSLASNKAEAIKTHHNDTELVRNLRAKVSNRFRMFMCNSYDLLMFSNHGACVLHFSVHCYRSFLCVKLLSVCHNLQKWSKLKPTVCGSR